MCDEADEGDVLLLCDSCNAAFHLQCTKPRLRKIPPGKTIPVTYCSSSWTRTSKALHTSQLLRCMNRLMQWVVSALCVNTYPQSSGSVSPAFFNGYLLVCGNEGHCLTQLIM